MYLALDRPQFSGSLCCPVQVPSLNCMNECSYIDLNIYTTNLKQTHSSDKLNFFKNYYTSGTGRQCIYSSVKELGISLASEDISRRLTSYIPKKLRTSLFYRKH